MLLLRIYRCTRIRDCSEYPTTSGLISFEDPIQGSSLLSVPIQTPLRLQVMTMGPTRQHRRSVLPSTYHGSRFKLQAFDEFALPSRAHDGRQYAYYVGGGMFR